MECKCIKNAIELVNRYGLIDIPDPDGKMAFYNRLSDFDKVVLRDSFIEHQTGCRKSNNAEVDFKKLYGG